MITLIFAVADFLQRPIVNTVRRVAVQVQPAHLPLEFKAGGLATLGNDSFKYRTARLGSQGHTVQVGTSTTAVSAVLPPRPADGVEVAPPSFQEREPGDVREGESAADVRDAGGCVQRCQQSGARLESELGARGKRAVGQTHAVGDRDTRVHARPVPGNLGGGSRGNRCEV